MSKKCKTYNDVELETLAKCLAWLWQLTPTARARVLEYLMQKHALEEETKKRLGPSAPEDTVPK